MRRIVDLYTIPGDQKCEEIREFLEQQDIRLEIRDIKKKPLRVNEIAKLIRHLELKHFLDTESAAYKKNKPDRLPSIVHLACRRNRSSDWGSRG